MGMLAKALAGPSAAAAKRSGIYDEIKDRIDGAILPAQLEDVEQWLLDNDHLYPATWRDSFDNMIELKREELASEDVGAILRERFDF